MRVHYVKEVGEIPKQKALEKKSKKKKSNVFL